MTRIAFARTACVLACGALLFACDAKETVVEQDFAFDGTCINCHDGLSAGQVHPTFKLRCIDCHGGNDQVTVPENAFEDPAIFRDPDRIAASHVGYKDPALARFFFANGIDDDGDGLVDEFINFDDIQTPTQVVNGDFGEVAELGLQGEGVGQFIDTEYNRDLNYTRWINPGDLRVATISCGSGSRVAGETSSNCHQNVVENMRRSIMVNQAAVINGAMYGNESWRLTFQTERDDIAPAADPRAGAFGYTLDYVGIDKCIATPEDIEDDPRAQPTFNSTCLELIATANDPDAQGGAPGNAGLPPFEAVQGKIEGSAPGTEEGKTAPHVSSLPGSGRLEGWGGKDVREVAAILPEMEPVPNEDLAADGAGLNFVGPIPDPVDNILRGFRAYYPLNYPGSTINQNFTFGESIEPSLTVFKNNNPFGRGHSMGCTACHMAYNYDGSRNPQVIQEELDEEGKPVVKVDPTTKHREFDPETQDIVEIDGVERLVGITVNVKDRDLDKDGLIEDGVTPDVDGNVAPSNDLDREQQRMYSANHELTSRITTQQCGLCHAFVTRINLAYQGMSEDEQRDALARNEPVRGIDRTISFTTPKGTKVNILDSMVREENNLAGEFQQLVVPAGVAIADLARKRDEGLIAKGFIAGNGGCGQETFTEDCNNNGELDTELVLQRIDAEGNPVGDPETIDEDLNGNGELDLIDHAPRELSQDGRQMRYVYGGANGSTRLMDIHFERGVHCIDCHMLQDSHGDGNLYSTNWEQIEIECEDCHGKADKPAELVTTGPNGGNDLTLAKDHDGRPFFERRGDKIIQRSRVTPGLAWEVPQTVDVVNLDKQDGRFFNPEAIEAHNENHLPFGDVNTSVFEGEPGQSEMQTAKLECYSCHMSWVINCVGCHFNTNGRIGNRISVDENGVLTPVAGENETWFNNSEQAALTNFQLLGFMRSPFILGVNATADEQRVGTFRSSMEVYVSVNDNEGFSILDNMTFTTFQATDANSGRDNVATSGSALNQTMPHTVRPEETRSCEQCHALVNEDGAVRNDHILAETFGLGSGRYGWAGNWAYVAGGDTLELFDFKQENQLIPNNRFPGIIVNGVDAADRVQAPVQANALPAGGVATDVRLIRNFNAEPAARGQTEVPTLTDIALVSFNNGNNGGVVLIDVSGRGRKVVLPLPNVLTINLVNNANAITHLSPEVSDPFVYVANGAAGVTPIKLDSTGIALAANVNFNDTVALTPVPTPAGATVTEVELAGDILYAGTQQGTLEVYDLANPAAPVHVRTVQLDAGQVNGLAVAGYFLYAATDQGLVIAQLLDDDLAIDLRNPQIPNGASAFLAVDGINGRELYFDGGRVYVAAGTGGVIELDVTTPADPKNLGDVVARLALQDQLGIDLDNVNIEDVTLSKLPSQTWLLAVEVGGDLIGLKLDSNLQSTREKCFPDPAAANCGLDMDFRDPTVMGRDPTFDPVDQEFDLNDPSANPVFRIATAEGELAGRRIARPGMWDKINTHTGRRMRDSFMPGSGVLSEPVMSKMYALQVCEDPNTPDISGNGLGALGFADDDFFATGQCTPFVAADGTFREPSTGDEDAALQAQGKGAGGSDDSLDLGSDDICVPDGEQATMCVATEESFPNGPETASAY